MNLLLGNLNRLTYLCSVSVLTLLYETTTEGHIEGVAVVNKFGVIHGVNAACGWPRHSHGFQSIKLGV